MIAKIANTDLEIDIPDTIPPEQQGAYVAQHKEMWRPPAKPWGPIANIPAQAVKGLASGMVDLATPIIRGAANLTGFVEGERNPAVYDAVQQGITNAQVAAHKKLEQLAPSRHISPLIDAEGNSSISNIPGWIVERAAGIAGEFAPYIAGGASIGATAIGMGISGGGQAMMRSAEQGETPEQQVNKFYGHGLADAVLMSVPGMELAGGGPARAVGGALVNKVLPNAATEGWQVARRLAAVPGAALEMGALTGVGGVVHRGLEGQGSTWGQVGSDFVEGLPAGVLGAAHPLYNEKLRTEWNKAAVDARNKEQVAESVTGNELTQLQSDMSVIRDNIDNEISNVKDPTKREELGKYQDPVLRGNRSLEEYQQALREKAAELRSVPIGNLSIPERRVRTLAAGLVEAKLRFTEIAPDTFKRADLVNTTEGTKVFQDELAAVETQRAELTAKHQSLIKEKAKATTEEEKGVIKVQLEGIRKQYVQNSQDRNRLRDILKDTTQVKGNTTGIVDRLSVLDQSKLPTEGVEEPSKVIENVISKAVTGNVAKATEGQVLEDIINTRIEEQRKGRTESGKFVSRKSSYTEPLVLTRALQMFKEKSTAPTHLDNAIKLQQHADRMQQEGLYEDASLLRAAAGDMYLAAERSAPELFMSYEDGGAGIRIPRRSRLVGLPEAGTVERALTPEELTGIASTLDSIDYSNPGKAYWTTRIHAEMKPGDPQAVADFIEADSKVSHVSGHYFVVPQSFKDKFAEKWSGITDVALTNPQYVRESTDILYHTLSKVAEMRMRELGIPTTAEQLLDKLSFREVDRDAFIEEVVTNRDSWEAAKLGKALFDAKDVVPGIRSELKNRTVAEIADHTRGLFLQRKIAGTKSLMENLILFNKGQADASTLFHELGHYFESQLIGTQLHNDLRMLGMKGKGGVVPPVSTEISEHFANAILAYMYTGKVEVGYKSLEPQIKYMSEILAENHALARMLSGAGGGIKGLAQRLFADLDPVVVDKPVNPVKIETVKEESFRTPEEQAEYDSLKQAQQNAQMLQKREEGIYRRMLREGAAAREEGTAPKRAGSIGVEGHSNERIRNLVAALEMTYPTEKLPTQTDKETKAKARKIAADPVLVAKALLDATTPEEIMVLRAAGEVATRDMLLAIKEAGADSDKVARIKAEYDTSEVMLAYNKAGHSAGQMLHAFGIPMSTQFVNSMEVLKKHNVDVSTIPEYMDLAQELSALNSTPDIDNAAIRARKTAVKIKMQQIIDKVPPVYWEDYIAAGIYSGGLSGIKLSFQSAATSILYQGWNATGDRILKAAVDAGLNRLGLKKNRSVYFNEVLPLIIGMTPKSWYKNMKGERGEWFREFAADLSKEGKLRTGARDIMKTGETLNPADLQGELWSTQSNRRGQRTLWNSKPVESMSKWLSKKLGADVNLAAWLNAGPDIQRCVDFFFSTMAYDAQMKSLTQRDAIINNPQNAKAEYDRLMKHNLDPVSAGSEAATLAAEKRILEAGLYARKVTFMDAPGAIMRGIIRLRDKADHWAKIGEDRYLPLGTIVAPFLVTRGNMVKRAMDMSLMAPLHIAKDLIDVKFSKGEVKSEAQTQLVTHLAELTVGASLAAAAFVMYTQGQMTGSPSNNKDKRELMERLGIPSYAFKIAGTDTWIRYKDVEPFALPLALIADTLESMRGGGVSPERAANFDFAGAEWDKIRSSVFNNIRDLIVDNSWMKNVQLLSSGTLEGVKRQAIYTAGTLVPWSQFSRELNSGLYTIFGSGNKQVSSPTLAQGMLNTIPIVGALHRGEEKVSLWGEGIKNLNIFSQWLPGPFSAQIENMDPVDKEFMELGRRLESVGGRESYPGIPLGTQSIVLKPNTPPVEIPDEVYKEFLLEYGVKGRAACEKVFSSAAYKNASPTMQEKMVDHALAIVRSQLENRLKAQMRKEQRF